MLAISLGDLVQTDFAVVPMGALPKAPPGDSVDAFFGYFPRHIWVPDGNAGGVGKGYWRSRSPIDRPLVFKPSINHPPRNYVVLVTKSTATNHVGEPFGFYGSLWREATIWDPPPGYSVDWQMMREAWKGWIFKTATSRGPDRDGEGRALKVHDIAIRQDIIDLWRSKPTAIASTKGPVTGQMMADGIESGDLPFTEAFVFDARVPGGKAFTAWGKYFGPSTGNKLVIQERTGVDSDLDPVVWLRNPLKTLGKAIEKGLEELCSVVQNPLTQVAMSYADAVKVPGATVARAASGVCSLVFPPSREDEGDGEASAFPPGSVGFYSRDRALWLIYAPPGSPGMSGAFDDTQGERRGKNGWVKVAETASLPSGVVDGGPDEIPFYKNWKFYAFVVAPAAAAATVAGVLIRRRFKRRGS